MSMNRKRGRPGVSPETRFSHEIGLWERAYNDYDALPVTIKLPTANEAIGLRHRLNLCRATFRELDMLKRGEDRLYYHHRWDDYVARAKGNIVTIDYRTPPQMVITDSKGNTITTQQLEVEAAESNMRREAEWNTPSRSIPTADPNLIPPPDPRRPLIDTEC